ncbi:MAG: LuxR C-terminal-related transcriptional regulator [Flavobacteriales bacterium]
MKNKVTIALAFDEFLLEAGLRFVLDKKEDFVIHSAVHSQEEISALFQSKMPPAILLIDIFSPHFDVDKVLAYSAFSQKTKVIPVTDARSKHDYLKLLKSGINSYLLKICDESEIIECVKKTIAGKNFVCAQVVDVLTDKNIAKEGELPYKKTCEGLNISDREIEIIKLIAEGRINKEIADTLFLSNHTINTHRKNIMQKLGINNTAGIVLFAVKEQIVSPNDFLFSSKD